MSGPIKKLAGRATDGDPIMDISDTLLIRTVPSRVKASDLQGKTRSSFSDKTAFWLQYKPLYATFASPFAGVHAHGRNCIPQSNCLDHSLDRELKAILSTERLTFSPPASPGGLGGQGGR